MLTSLGLRSPECRRFRAEITQAFDLEQPTSEPVPDGEAPLSIGVELVPDGLHTSKFITSTGNVNGVIYLDPANGDPLWFTMKNTKQLLIPTGALLNAPLFFVLNFPQ